MHLFALLCTTSALKLRTDDHLGVNPIRKIVKLLQDMQVEIETEGAKEKDLYENFQCYCHGNTDGMSKDAEAAAERISKLQAKLEQDEAEKSALDQELMGHKQDRTTAEADLQEATGIRAKEHAAYLEHVGEAQANIDALSSAVTALAKGMGTAMVQMGSQMGARIAAMVKQSQSVGRIERSAVLAFVEGRQNPFGDYSAQSGEIVGILKNMKDEMDSDLNGVVGEEEQAQSSFEGLASAKKSEIAAAGRAIEAKTKRSGSLAVAIVTAKDDITDTTKELGDTQAFLANLAASCAAKQAEWDTRQKTRASEVSAISQAITILNDDDALDLFKKTLSLSQTPSLLQKDVPSVRARDLLVNAKGPHSAQLALIAYALQSRSVDFSKVIAMCDAMVATLEEEGKADGSQKSFCEKDLASSEHEQEDLEAAVDASEALIAETQEGSEATAAEVAGLKAEITALDRAVSDATKQRQGEHEDFLQFQTENSAALQLIEKATNRLAKFYRPQSAPKPALVQKPAPVYLQLRARDAPAPPPETWGAYQTKEGKSNGVLALMDGLARKLSDETTESKHDEETSQSDYEGLMARSQASRSQMVESITSKEAAKADLDIKVEHTKEKQTGQAAELANVKDYLHKLHASCDFLLSNFDLRAAARANEVESLKNAKSVLSGASFS